ncbi:MAG: preprotein translocase subunit SecE [Gemmatimonadota bacterium]|nr:preprotein translocase subunit SecE [Gemmatimonadota bacterium]
MAVEGASLPPAPENRVMATARGIPGFYRAVMIEMKKVTWPEIVDVRRATIAIIIFVLLLGLAIFIMDFVLQQLLGRLIPSLFTGR